MTFSCPFLNIPISCQFYPPLLSSYSSHGLLLHVVLFLCSLSILSTHLLSYCISVHSLLYFYTSLSFFFYVALLRPPSISPSNSNDHKFRRRVRRSIAIFDILEYQIPQIADKASPMSLRIIRLPLRPMHRRRRRRRPKKNQRQ